MTAPDDLFPGADRYPPPGGRHDAEYWPDNDLDDESNLTPAERKHMDRQDEEEHEWEKA